MPYNRHEAGPHVVFAGTGKVVDGLSHASSDTPTHLAFTALLKTSAGLCIRTAFTPRLAQAGQGILLTARPRLIIGMAACLYAPVDVEESRMITKRTRRYC